MKLNVMTQIVGFAFILVLAPTVESWAANCGVTSTGNIPLDDLGSGLYLGQFQGGKDAGRTTAHYDNVIIFSHSIIPSP